MRRLYEVCIDTAVCDGAAWHCSTRLGPVRKSEAAARSAADAAGGYVRQAGKVVYTSPEYRIHTLEEGKMSG